MLVDGPTLDALKQQIKCRNRQLDLLNGYLWQNATMCPPAILVHGATSTGKSTVINGLLEASNVAYAAIKCDQCVSTKMLLQRIYKGIAKSFGTTPDREMNDNFALFFAAIEPVLSDKNKMFFLVLDQIDQFLDSSGISDLINVFARHAELSLVTNMSVIFTISSLQPKALVSTSIPNLHFPRYSLEEAGQVVSSLQLCKLPEQYDSPHFWENFCQLVINGLNSYTGTDIRLIKDIALRLWPEYVKPVLSGTIKPNESQKLYKEAQSLFTTQWAVSNNLITDATTKKQQHDLTVHCKYILCAAYLASYNPPKTDMRFFSKAKDIRITRREIRNEANGKHLCLFNRRSLAAPSFELERMLAILHAIADTGIVSNIALQSQIGTLVVLRLLIRTGGDPLGARSKWRVNVGWSMVQQIARDIGLDIKDYLYE